MKRKNLPLTRARLMELLKYDPRTGEFVRLVTVRGFGARAGTRAGSLWGTGYRMISIDNVRYLEQHLAWFYYYGHWPRNELDHINRVRDDNRLCNLRAATQSQNNANSAASPRNKLGVKGVRLMGNRYAAQLGKGGIFEHLGMFDTIEEASAAFQARHRELYGAFSCVHNPGSPEGDP